jgi:transcriptional regulator GlxA family with amidase domain
VRCRNLDARALPAKAGATTHHDFFDEFERRFPKVALDRGARFVRSAPGVFTAGGLTSGVDLALHVVALYFGKDAALATARYMEYVIPQGISLGAPLGGSRRELPGGDDIKRRRINPTSAGRR